MHVSLARLFRVDDKHNRGGLHASTPLKTRERVSLAWLPLADEVNKDVKRDPSKMSVCANDFLVIEQKIKM